MDCLRLVRVHHVPISILEILDLFMHRLMADLVAAEHGRNYERAFIECWIHEHAGTWAFLGTCILFGGLDFYSQCHLKLQMLLKS